MFLELDELKDHEEDLDKEAESVSNVQNQYILNGKGDEEWDYETQGVESEHELKELPGFYKLEVDDFSHSLKVVEAKMLIIFNKHYSCQVLVIEINSSESILKDISDLFTNDNFLEVNKRVLDLNIFVSKYLFGFLIKILNAPSHVWIFAHDFFNDFHLWVVMVLEVFHAVILSLLASKRWQIWVEKELLKVAELSLDFMSKMNSFLVFLNLEKLFMISFKEWINSFNLTLFKHIWKIQHHNLLIGWSI